MLKISTIVCKTLSNMARGIYEYYYIIVLINLTVDVKLERSRCIILGKSAYLKGLKWRLQGLETWTCHTKLSTASLKDAYKKGADLAAEDHHFSSTLLALSSLHTLHTY